MIGGQDIGRLGHEMDTAEDDIGRICISGLLRKFERVARNIGEIEYLFTLVVVAENQDLVTQFGF